MNDRSIGETMNFNETTDLLREVDVPIVNQKECYELYEGIITNQMICAAHKNGGKDSCAGDSGGPLSAINSNGEIVLIGVVSFGAECADPIYPGVFARVASVRAWIEKVTGI